MFEDFGNTAVILIDMQRKFFESIHRDFNRVELLHYQQQVIRECVIRDIPFVEVCYEGYGPTISPLDNLIAQLKTKRTIIKSEADAFSNPQLNEQLSQWGIKKNFYMGLYACRCIWKTARKGLEHGYGIMTSPQVIAPPRIYPSSWDWLSYYERNGEVVHFN